LAAARSAPGSGRGRTRASQDGQSARREAERAGRICEEKEPPIRRFGQRHRIACHIAPEELERVDPVIVLADKEAAG
jgi:hypothetical protein